jgi:hypothetical protein
MTAAEALLVLLMCSVTVGTSLTHRPIYSCFMQGRLLPSIVQNRVKDCSKMPKMQLQQRKSIRIEIGNTYAPVPSHLAELSRSSLKKIHDWTLFAQPVDPRNAALISKV